MGCPLLVSTWPPATVGIVRDRNRVMRLLGVSGIGDWLSGYRSPARPVRQWLGAMKGDRNSHRAWRQHRGVGLR